MRLMRILIVLILCMKSLYRALPVQSQALENTDDQLFWQAAWFSEDSKPASPFTSDSKKITAKSIFITPNFINQPAQYCPDGYRIDNGKCIKIVKNQQTSEELLATRLAGFITTDDTTNFDYDYDSLEDDQNKNENQEEVNLPLVPIIHESLEDTDSNSNNFNRNNNNINAKNITVKENEMTTAVTSHTFHDFHTESKTDSVEIIITTLSNDDEISSNNTLQMTTYEHDNATIKPSVNEFEDVNEHQLFSLESTTTTTAASAALEQYESITEMNSNENETSVMQDLSSKDNQNVEPFLLPMAERGLERENFTKNFTIIDKSIMNNSNDDDDEILSNSTVLDYNENSQTEESIIESSDTINFDDSSFLLNDSLIMIDTNNNNNNNKSNVSISSSYSDYDDITTIDPFTIRSTDEQTNKDAPCNNDDNDNVSSITEQKMLIDENLSTLRHEDLDKTSFMYETTSYYGSSHDSRENDETNKFIYHVPIEITTVVAQSDSQPATIQVTTEPTAEKGNKLKFPDEDINNRVRFPDDDNNSNQEIASTATSTARIQSRLLPASSVRISWPRENNNNQKLTTNIFQFWNQQPLLNDFQRVRENSKNFRSENFFPYTRKVQIVTPQRYSYK